MPAPGTSGPSADVDAARPAIYAELTCRTDQLVFSQTLTREPGGSIDE